MRAELRTGIKGLGAKADAITWLVGIVGFQTGAIIGGAVVLARLLAH